MSNGEVGSDVSVMVGVGLDLEEDGESSVHMPITFTTSPALRFQRPLTQLGR